MLGGRLAAAHDAGKVVLRDLGEGDRTAAIERHLLRTGDDTAQAGYEPSATTAAGRAGETGGAAGGPDGVPTREPAVAMAVSELRSVADRLESEIDVACEVVVGDGCGAPIETDVVIVARE